LLKEKVETGDEMNILTLNPPFHPKYSRGQRSPAVIKSGTVYYPIWLSYATGVLEQNGFNVKLVDAPAAGHDLGYVLDLVDQFQPRLVVMDTSTPSVYNDVEMAQAIKARAPGVFVVLVGPHVTALPEETLKIGPAVDAVARSEYDHTIRDLALAIQSGADWDSVLGLTFRVAGASGEVVSNPDRPFIANLDELPFVSKVYKRHLDVRDYFYSITQYPEVTLITGRGCPYKCVYCVWPQTLSGHGYRRRSVANVADEFEFIKHELPQVKEVFLEDDTLTVHQRRAVALGEELAQRGVNLPFTANSRADVSYETLYWLKQGGLRLLCVGFESGDQAVLDAMKKQAKIEQFFQFRQDASRAGVLIHGCFMAGTPGETKETLAKTLRLAKELNPDTAQFFPIMVYPGTEAYEWAKRNDYLATQDFREWLTEDGLHKSVVNQPGLTAQELVEWCDRARREFYLRPSYIWSKIRQVITQPREARRILKSFRVFVKYLLRPPSKAETNV
jgi:anaerobic magnesium-protoporphyrin IX monomethyl ester cyclase